MAKFTLATLNTKDGARAAIGVGDGYYLLRLAQPLLRDLTVRRILETWETSLPVLEALSYELSAGKVHATKIAAASAEPRAPLARIRPMRISSFTRTLVTDRCFNTLGHTPVMCPSSLLKRVGGNHAVGS
jgi:hypothetical protein